MKSGMRVIRGPDWASKKQDGGEGHTGTLVYVPKKGSSDKVTVIWDSGRELRYRAGQDGKYDLRVFDNAPAGIKHDHITCDSCHEDPVCGFRWKCSECHDFDLCTACYMSGKHDLAHGFLRMDGPQSTALPVACRSQSKSKRVMGIFGEATVMRGPHWKWKNDDGGSGEVGIVQEVTEWNTTSYHGGVKVKWKATKKVGTYRLGGEGSVDVLYSAETSPPYQCYISHLPVVDVVSPGKTELKCSDKVQVCLDVASFRQLQDNLAYGSWNDKMIQCINEIGTIVKIVFGGKTIILQYEDERKWTVNRQALTRIHSFSRGEVVQVLENVNAVRELQDGHGGWNSDMKQDLGKSGRIISIDDDGDMHVKVGGHKWLLSPVCCSPIDDAKELATVPELSDSDRQLGGSDEVAEMADQLHKVIASLFTNFLKENTALEDDGKSLVEAAAKGDMDSVKDIMAKHPTKVNTKLEGKTALQLASHEGHCGVISFLLDHKADINAEDEDGDTALHYSAFGQEVEAMRILLERGADKDAQNEGGVTPLHITIGKAHLDCTRLLMSKNPSANLKDDGGDTPMHDCIIQKKQQPHLTKAIFEAKGADFTVTNDKGFNVLHWATLKDSRSAVEIILSKNKGMVNVKMKEGFTALHIAAANDHVEIAGMLLEEGKCDKNPVDGNGRTPIHVAVSQGHKRTVELLVTMGSDVNIQDKDGNTPIHVTQIRQALPKQLAELLGVHNSDASNVGVHISCSLLEAGAKLDMKNHQGHTPLDLCPDSATREFMQRIAKQAASKSQAASTKGTVQLPSHWAKMDREVRVLRVPLDTGSDLLNAEYQQVERNFRKTLSQPKILKVERIQNKFLWEHYSLTRMRFESEYGKGKINQRDAYHGTMPQNIARICDENIDHRLHGERVGTLFGKGAYFASEAKYADGYAKADQQNKKYMFQTKILAGKMTYGDEEYKRPPPIKHNDPNSKLYDCCVDNPDEPRIFCLFDQNQFYPEYLIEYM